MNSTGMIPVACLDAQAKYDGRTVSFCLKSETSRIPLEGRFHVKVNPTRISIEVKSWFDGNAFRGAYFHLSQIAVDSIRPSEGSEVAWEVASVLDHLIR